MISVVLTNRQYAHSYQRNADNQSVFRSSCVNVYPKIGLKYNETLGPLLGIKHPSQDTDTRRPLLFFVCS